MNNFGTQNYVIVLSLKGFNELTTGLCGGRNEDNINKQPAEAGYCDMKYAFFLAKR